MEEKLTTHQKIELLKLAATIDAPLGNNVATLDTTISNYDKLLETIYSKD
jgi:hypothetical protein